MRDFFDEFDREFNKLFRLSFSNFNRPVKDMQPYRLTRTENGLIFTINTLGIDKEDIVVQIKTQKGDPYRQLHVKGTTKMEKINFENNVELAIRLGFEDEIEDVLYEVKNGLTVVYLKLRKEPENKLEAKYIDEDFDF